MLTIETTLRVAIVGQHFLIALFFIFGRGDTAIRAAGVGLLLGVSSYVLMSSPDLQDRVALFQPILLLFALVVPHLLWLFARAIFEASWPASWISAALILLAVIVWSILLGADRFDAYIVAVAGNTMRVASLIIVGHAIFLAAKGRPDDLIERRRLFRTIFVVVVAAQIAGVIVAELILQGADPQWLVMINLSLIEMLTIVLLLPLLSLNPDFFTPTPMRDAGSRGADELSPADSVLKQKLLSAMDEGVYRQSGLTITTLAEQLEYPEHQLRRLINGHLGYRNFSAFLNTYRIAEAKRNLADSRQVRTPILTIALDLGYGSLGPFNRAFKLDTGMTPTEFRNQKVRSQIVESG